MLSWVLWDLTIFWQMWLFFSFINSAETWMLCTFLLHMWACEPLRESVRSFRVRNLSTPALWWGNILSPLTHHHFVANGLLFSQELSTDPAPLHGSFPLQPHNSLDSGCVQMSHSSILIFNKGSIRSIRSINCPLSSCMFHSKPQRWGHSLCLTQELGLHYFFPYLSSLWSCHTIFTQGELLVSWRILDMLIKCSMTANPDKTISIFVGCTKKLLIPVVRHGCRYEKTAHTFWKAWLCQRTA